MLKTDPKVVLTRKYISKSKEAESESNFIPLEDVDVEESNKLCILSDGGESENTFKIEKVPEREKLELLFARSTLPLFEYISRIFARRDKKRLKPSLYKKIDKMLKKICCFVFDIQYKKDTDIFAIPGQPNRYRQKILRDYNLIDFMTDMLERPFSTENFFDIKSLTQDMHITKILSMTYTTIKYLIRDNRANELYCSQWLNLFLVQSLKTRGSNEINAEQTLTELIDNNERILKTRVRKETINKFLQLVSQDKISKYLKILRVIIVCDGKPMKNNQREISKLVLKDQRMQKQLLYDLRTVEHTRSPEHQLYEVEILIQEKGWESISAMDKKYAYLRKDSESIYDFFISLIYLLGDLCLDRNYLAIDSLQAKYTFDLCRSVILNTDLKLRVRDAFCYLMNALWIDVAPFQKQNMPNMIVKWDSLDNVHTSKKLKSSSKVYFGEQIVTDVNYLMFKKQVLAYLDALTDKELRRLEVVTLSISKMKLVKNLVELNMVSTSELKGLYLICKKLAENTLVHLK